MELAVFKQRVGQRLGIVPAAGSLAAEDAELVTSAYESLFAELYENSLAPWGTGTIPDEYADIVIGMTAARLVDEFKIPEPRRSSLVMLHAFGLPQPSSNERRLRRLIETPPEDEGAPERYF